MIDNRSDLAESRLHTVALDCIEAGIGRVLPQQVVTEALTLDGDVLRITDSKYDLSKFDEIVVVGGGKATCHLAAEVERILGDRIRRGIVVTDTPGDTERIGQVRGAHPIPDEAGVAGARRVLEIAEHADDDTLIIALITGGGSALLPAPAPPVSLEDLQTLTDQLVLSGATIQEINAVRKHVSAMKGGQLARAGAPAAVIGLVMSDVVGNRLDVIASGPLSPDDSTYEEARAVLAKHDIEAPVSVRERLVDGVKGAIPETPAADSGVFDKVSIHVLADGLMALEAAADAAADHGYEPLVLSSRIRGEASAAAKTQVGIAEEIAATGTPVEPPAVVLTGGETTVTVEGDGEGGPNQEFALSGAIELDGPGVCIAAVDTDGIDGSTDVAGAIVTAADSESGDEADSALLRNDVNPFLAARGSVIETGPTGTNVNDLRVLIVDE